MKGKIFISVVEFYDSKNKRTSFKKRPVLILSDIRNNDYTVFPISTISISSNIDAEYDIKIEPTDYPKLKLERVSYIRTHKKIFLHRAGIDKTNILGDIKNDYPNLFLEILEKMEKFDKLAIDNALE